MATHGTWIDHFQDNFTWSNATLVCKGMAPWGAGAIEEIDRIGEKLKARAGDPDAWWQEWCAMADKIAKTADEAAAAGRQFTAGNYYIRAGNFDLQEGAAVFPRRIGTALSEYRTRRCPVRREGAPRLFHESTRRNGTRAHHGRVRWPR